MTVNKLPDEIKALKPLIDLYGERAVEFAVIAIRQSYDRRGLRVIIKAEPNRVRAVLEAIYGRPGVNEVWL